MPEQMQKTHVLQATEHKNKCLFVHNKNKFNQPETYASDGDSFVVLRAKMPYTVENIQLNRQCHLGVAQSVCQMLHSCNQRNLSAYSVNKINAIKMKRCKVG